jgi:hypothetical protein
MFQKENKNKEIVYPNVEIWNTVKRYFESDSATEKDEKVLKSIYSTEIINPVTFNSGFYYYKPHLFNEDRKSTDFFENKTFQTFHNNLKSSGIMEKKQMADYTLPPTTIVQFSRHKNMIKTNTLGGLGTKKEFYGFDDWQINIQILCINESNRTAREARDQIIDWAMLLDNIQVSGDIFTRKKIYAIVIEDIDLISVTGSPNVFPINLRCVSSDPELLLLNHGLKDQYFLDKKMQDFDKIIKSTDFNN